MKILVVEQSKFFLSVIRKGIEGRLHVDVVCARNYVEAESIVVQYAGTIELALVDINLPDSPEGAIVDLMAQHSLPTIVFTGWFSDDMRNTVLSKNVIDYVLKDNPSSLDYVVELVQRILSNNSRKVLVVDDSRTARMHITRLLQQHRFSVREAENGLEALDMFQMEPDITLVVTDHNMPEMDGFQLTKRLRAAYPKDELAIIGMSASGEKELTARFMKNGANDFINKPFIVEEFFCRVYQNLSFIDHVKALKDAAGKDFLTGLANRRRFFEIGRAQHATSLREGRPIAVAMADIDYFKKINDTWGHDSGDVVIQYVANLLRQTMRPGDMVARFGGEEFCVLAPGLPEDSVFDVFERLRAAVADHPLVISEQEIPVTVSVGVSTLATDLDAMISAADKSLYEAKTSGRNKVVVDN